MRGLGIIQLAKRTETDARVLQFLSTYRYSIRITKSWLACTVDCPSIITLHRQIGIERKSLTKSLERLVVDGRVGEITPSPRKRRFYYRGSGTILDNFIIIIDAQREIADISRTVDYAMSACRAMTNRFERCSFNAELSRIRNVINAYKNEFRMVVEDQSNIYNLTTVSRTVRDTISSVHAEKASLEKIMGRIFPTGESSVQTATL